MPEVAQRFVAVASCDERAGEGEVGAGEARVDLRGAPVGGDGGVAALRFAEVEPGQDEVGAAGDGALERRDRFVAAGEDAEVVVDLDLLRIEPGRLAKQLQAFVAM